MTLDEILEEIKSADKIVILTHETPDGDAIGSCLGLKLALEKIGKTFRHNYDKLCKNI